VVTALPAGVTPPREDYGDFEVDVPQGIEVLAWDADGVSVSTSIVGTQGSTVVSDDVQPDGTWTSGGWTTLEQLSVALPSTAGVAKLQVLDGGVVVHQTVAGPRAPVVEDVTLVEVNGEWQVSWQAFDPEGDYLWVTIYLVRGDERELLRTGDIKSPTLIPARTPDGAAYRVLVVVNDGLNAGWGASEPLG